ncbi:MAG: hypothetical protein AB7H66_10935 [Hyphomonadaceae bacterium]
MFDFVGQIVGMLILVVICAGLATFGTGFVAQWLQITDGVGKGLIFVGVCILLHMISQALDDEPRAK